MPGRRPSLIGRAARTAGRTAIIAGTATAVSGAVAGRRAGKDAQSDQPPAGLSPEAMAQLEKLAQLHESGVLTAEEFATQKARILG